jgi:hypothetical protein
MNTKAIYTLAMASIAVPMAEVATRRLMHEADAARIAWEAAGSPDSGPEHDTYDDAAARFQASVVAYVEAFRLRESAFKRVAKEVQP